MGSIHVSIMLWNFTISLTRTCMAEKFFITINTRNIDSERKTVYVHPKFTTVAKDPRIVFAISGKILLQADATEIFFILHQTLSPFFFPLLAWLWLADFLALLLPEFSWSFSSSSCQLFALFFLFSLFNFSSSCFLRLYSFLFSLSCNFFCFSVSCLAFFLVSYQVKFALTQGHSQNLEYFFWHFYILEDRWPHEWERLKSLGAPFQWSEIGTKLALYLLYVSRLLKALHLSKMPWYFKAHLL